MNRHGAQERNSVSFKLRSVEYQLRDTVVITASKICQSFMDDVKKRQHAFNLSGVDAHSQNEVAVIEYAHVYHKGLIYTASDINIPE